MYRFLLSALLLANLRCADYPVLPQTQSLDYLEFHAPHGWVLRVDGDGGGRLSCRSLPGRSIVYLPATFQIEQAERRVESCHVGISITSPDCLRAVYFSQSTNATFICYCPDSSWTHPFFNLAFTEIRHSPTTRKDRRMLQKAWVMEPPLG